MRVLVFAHPCCGRSEVQPLPATHTAEAPTRLGYLLPRPTRQGTPPCAFLRGQPMHPTWLAPSATYSNSHRSLSPPRMTLPSRRCRTLVSSLASPIARLSWAIPRGFSPSLLAPSPAYTRVFVCVCVHSRTSGRTRRSVTTTPYPVRAERQLTRAGTQRQLPPKQTHTPLRTVILGRTNKVCVRASYPAAPALAVFLFAFGLPFPSPPPLPTPRSHAASDAAAAALVAG